jgi:hypothetical protein
MQGELPSHPKLLDWLAVDFMEHGWDVKRLVKQMVISATYRQSAVTDPEKLAKDPENIFLSRSSRYHIAAENIRDLVLASSGLLVPKIGGPSVKPYQPPGLWEGATSGRGLLSIYVQDHGESLYRRGIYNFIKLTVPPPKAIIFDSSNRDRCEITRNRTNTPLQALAMMNDPMVLEAARVLATKLSEKYTKSDLSINEAFKRIVCRELKTEEKELLQNYYDTELKHFQTNPKDAAAILDVGEYPIHPRAITPQNAALMQVIVSLYNLEETITKS